jgi:predicted transcriptional regulator
MSSSAAIVGCGKAPKLASVAKGERQKVLKAWRKCQLDERMAKRKAHMEKRLEKMQTKMEEKQTKMMEKMEKKEGKMMEKMNDKLERMENRGGSSSSQISE